MSEVEAIWAILHNASPLLSHPEGLPEFERIYSELGSQEDRILVGLARKLSKVLNLAVIIVIQVLKVIRS